MSEQTETSARATLEESELLEIDLRDPRVAVFLGWLVPGAGHLYQGRTAKGLMFLVCVWGTFFFGMYLGDNKVVYASNKPGQRRLAYLCQIGVGIPSVVALIQSYRMGQEPAQAPLGNYMAPPRQRNDSVPRHSIPPEQALYPQRNDPYAINTVDELHEWHNNLHGYFELGTVYTMIAGLLNVLVMYDAWAGPLLILVDKEGKQARKEESETV